METSQPATNKEDRAPMGCKLPAVGDWVTGISAGRRWQGRVQQIEPGRAVVEIDGAWLVVDTNDIRN